MRRSYRSGIGARGAIGIAAVVVDECSVSIAVMPKCPLSASSGQPWQTSERRLEAGSRHVQALCSVFAGRNPIRPQPMMPLALKSQ